jgi:hypothetical protein
MEYIKSFNEESLCEFILKTQKSLFVVMPLIQPLVLEAIYELEFNLMGNVSIHLGFDFSPETFRQGYGEIDSFEDILKTDYQILNLKDNRVSFIISDDTGYFLFIESRYFIPAEKTTINAVKIDPISVVRLRQHFFQTLQKAELTDQLANAIIDESVQFKHIEQEFENQPMVLSTVIDDKIIDEVREDLEINPPLKPDYKRIVEYYSSQFQYAKLVFSGANLKTKKIDLPKDALPIKNTELKNRLETKLNLFANSKVEDTFSEIEEVKVEVKLLRENYLTVLKKRDESILDIQKKMNFEKEIDRIKKSIPEKGTKILNRLATSIDKTKKQLRLDLIDFYLQNPEVISNDKLFLKSDDSYKHSEACNYADYTINRIKWPKPHELINEMKLSVFFSNITIEDLRNEEFRNELKENDLITDDDFDRLATFGKAIEVKTSKE